MSSRVLFILIFGSILQCLYDIFITDRLSKSEAKKAHFNCDKCGNWKCYYHYCKEELLKNGK